MRIPLALVVPCLLAACAPIDPGLRYTTVLHYQHVANVHRIDFSTPVPLQRRAEPARFVQPLESEGFWAVFLLCSLDASGADIPSFYLDVDRLRVAHGKQRFGPLRPYTLRIDDSTDLNALRDTRTLAGAIAAEIGEGVPGQVFRHGFYPRLDIRFAIYVPHGLPGYSGDELALRYEGSRSTMVLGNGHPPSSIPLAGLGGTGIASHCLP